MKQIFYSLFVLTILIIGFQYQPILVAEINQGLVLYLPFEEVGNPADHSDNPAKPKKDGKLERVNGKFGKALKFNGEGANVVEVPSVAKLAGMKALTIAAWIKPNGIKGADGMSVASKRIGHQNGDCYNLFTWTDQKMHARVNSKGQIVSNTILKDGEWYHVAFTFEGGSKIKLYLNGGEEVSIAHPDKAVLNDNKSPLWIGELNAGRNFAWNGILDDVAMWNRALSEKDIQSVMNKGLQLLLAVDPINKLAVTWAEFKK